jgi:cyclic pyranopterin phosphate synthase
VSKVRFTGGEPLVRRGVIPFLREFRKTFPGIAVSLTTNASLLEPHADDLSEIGLSGVNISLDTMDPDKFKTITRVWDILGVRRGMSSARRAGIKNIKTNTVLIRGFNDLELPDILGCAWENDFTPRVIEFMPVSPDLWREELYISAGEIMERLGGVGGGAWREINGSVLNGAVPSGPARYYMNADGRVVGVIEAVSNHFCSSCNRLRVTASGGLRTCLFSRSETDLGAMLRERDAPGLRAAVLESVRTKPDWREGELGDSGRMSGIGG